MSTASFLGYVKFIWKSSNPYTWFNFTSMMIMSLTSHIFVIYDIMITEVKGKVKAIRRKFTNKKAGRALHPTSSSW
jgi:hypothetical protein